jgi:hypothetical protein
MQPFNRDNVNRSNESMESGMPFVNDNPASWVPPAEAWQPESVPALPDPYNEDPYFPDPYARL